MAAALRGRRSSVSASARLSVAVLVELERAPSAGGHVKCWERFAAAATDRHDLDLTIYVLGKPGPAAPLSPHVRIVPLRPVLSTRPLHRLIGGVDASDLAPFHPSLARLLPRHRVWHVTHSLSFGATAARLAPRHGRALVGSVHTDVPSLTRTYVNQVLDRMPAGAPRTAVGALRLDDLAYTLARRSQDRVLRACRHVLVASPLGPGQLAGVVPPERVTLLRRGVDTERFQPDPSARRWLTDTHGVPAGRPLVLFAGRVDATKGVQTLAQAVHRLRGTEVPAHLVVAGSGVDVPRVRALLGSGASMLGHVPQEQLARVYAGCDAFAFPSRSETIGNVVAEAMASGLPVLLPSGAATTQWLSAPGADGVVVDDDCADTWADALSGLLADEPRRAAMGRRARATMATRALTWAQALDRDLMPVWRAAACQQR